MKVNKTVTTETETKTFSNEAEAVKYWNSKSHPSNVSNELLYNKDGTYTVETVKPLTK